MTKMNRLYIPITGEDVHCPVRYISSLGEDKHSLKINLFEDQLGERGFLISINLL